jgi:ATP-dependent Zn protease
MQLVRDARSIARLAGRPLAADDLKAALLETGSHDTSVEARICVHEAGHATMALALSYGTLRHALVGAKVGIRNRTLIDAGDPNFATLKDIEDRATVLLAGRSAEREICNSISLGSGGDESSDVGQATIAMAAARSSYCIAGDIAFQGRPNEVAEAIRYDRQLRDEVEADLQRLQKRADDLIAKHRGAVLAIADALRTRRHVDGKELRRIFDAAAATRAVTRARGAAE